MTAIDPIPESTTQPWNDLFEELKTRYPKVREPILAALAALMQNPDIDAEHAKAVAAANGIRITAASIAGAHRHLARQDGRPVDRLRTRPPGRPPRRPRRTRPAFGAHERLPMSTRKQLIRGVVAEIQNAGNAEADRLRDAIQKAIAVLQAAVA